MSRTNGYRTVGGMINYTTEYIYLMKTPNGIKNLTNSLKDEYIDSS